MRSTLDDLLSLNWPLQGKLHYITFTEMECEDLNC